MKAFLYAVRGDSGWLPFVSAAAEVDRLFWTEPAFRAGVAEGLGWWEVPAVGVTAAGLAVELPCRRESRLSAGGAEAEVVWLREALPLGIADSAREAMRVLWEQAGGARDVQEELCAAVRWAVEKAGEAEDGE